MAKVSFSKLNLNKNTEVSTFEWGDQNIEVKDYLPIGDKLNLISEIINDSIDKNQFISENKNDINRKNENSIISDYEENIKNGDTIEFKYS